LCSIDAHSDVPWALFVASPSRIRGALPLCAALENVDPESTSALSWKTWICPVVVWTTTR
jgi:hypothetical protein